MANTPFYSCNAYLRSVESLATPLHYVGNTILGRDFLIGTRASEGGMQVSSLNPDFSKILIWKAMLPERQPLRTLTWVVYKSWEVCSKQSLVNKWVLIMKYSLLYSCEIKCDFEFVCIWTVRNNIHIKMDWELG